MDAGCVAERVYVPGRLIKRELREFYQQAGLQLDFDWDCLVLLREQGQVVASGCRKGNILQRIAVHPVYRDQGLAAILVSELVKESVEWGINHLFLFTRPNNRVFFQSLGFFPVIETSEVLMLENRKKGLERFLDGIPPVSGERVGCIVAHANPFTLGHLALLQYASQNCQAVYLFILSATTAPFSPDERLRMARLAAAHFSNVLVLPGGEYILSHTTFPDYFYPDQVVGRAVNCQLDLLLFARRIAPRLGINARFVGEEPFSAVTAEYNKAMADLLPKEGIQVGVLPRFEKNGRPVSATRVREALAAGDWETAASLTPEVCHPVLKQHLAKLGGLGGLDFMPR